MVKYFSHNYANVIIYFHKDYKKQYFHKNLQAGHTYIQRTAEKNNLLWICSNNTFKYVYIKKNIL